ncbi:MAG: hypothetical protein MJE66_08460 [Proteobacteria bacterium]|nr:hypothetical protein [Pseudomonadota bacterium]
MDVAPAVAGVARQLTEIYALADALAPDFDASAWVVAPEAAQRLLPEGSPRTGLAVIEEGDSLWLGLYVDPRDAHRTTIVEETSHLLCVLWHAARELSVSRLDLEIQSEVDRYAVARSEGRSPLAHFESFHWAAELSPADRRRYELAHRVAFRYCRGLEERYPRRTDTPAWLAELRRFYRAAPESKHALV